MNGGYIYSYWDYKPTYNWGGHHLVTKFAHVVRSQCSFSRLTFSPALAELQTSSVEMPMDSKKLCSCGDSIATLRSWRWTKTMEKPVENEGVHGKILGKIGEKVDEKHEHHGNIMGR